ncbi:MAG: tyrosine decarboxylase MfnA [Thermoplasmata archaeon]|nr:tyrosine decarboxylase MfnA [Thermoplasmata archaeon]
MFGSMCTAPHPLAIEAHALFIEANLGNPGLYPGTADLERDVIRWLGELLSHPTAFGHVVSGGTEANITALWIARNLTRRRKVIYGQTAHFSFGKAVDLLGLEPVVVGQDASFRIDVDAVAREIDGDTLAVVGVAGTTELGVVDPIADLAEAVDGRAFLHVDAAFGGMVLPFLRRMGHDVPPFDFSVDGVFSVSTDPHKMGLSTVPSGAILFREEQGAELITVEAPYLTVKDQRSLSGTRCSAAVAASWAVMSHLGREGYTRVVERCMSLTERVADGVRGAGAELVLDPPPMNIVAFHHERPGAVVAAMKEKGWCLSRATHPRAVRIVVMPHAREETVDAMVADLGEVLQKV